MAKISRVNGNVQAFASAAIGTERTIFGEVTQSNDLTAQFTADFLRGWGIVGPSDQPTLEDFNGAMYTHGQLLAYLHQMGVAEYNAAQEYHADSITTSAGVMYMSLVANNIGNDPASSPSEWKAFLTPVQATEATAGISALASTAEATAGVNDTKAMTPLKVKQAIAAQPSASETVSGIVELATTAEVLAGTDTTRAVTSAGLLAGLLGAGGTSSGDYATIPYRDKTTGVRRQLIVQWGQVASGGLSGTITFPLAFPNAVFSVVGTVYAAGSGGYNLNYGVSPSLSSIVWGLSIATAHRWIAVGY